MDDAKKSFRLWTAGIALYCLIVFGFAGFSGRPLTMHEARLPETSREMLFRHEWLLPTSGGRPWLERPPLPHWIVIGLMKLTGRIDQVWVVRLPSALMGMITVLLTIYITSRWFDRRTALATGAVLATSLLFYQYSVLAEDDIYLAALLSLAAVMFTVAQTSAACTVFKWTSFFTTRQWAVIGFFVVLGISNLTRGPLLGIVYLGVPVAVYCFAVAWMDRSPQPVLRYTWLWGWIVLIALAIAWPAWAMHRYPDVLDNLKYDYLGRVNGSYAAINQPVWYYFVEALPAGMLPWTPLCAWGLWIALRRIKEKSYLWILCWALVPLLVFSIPHGKHEHYLVPFLAPWGVLGGLGLIDIINRMKPRAWMCVGVMCITGMVYCVGEARFAAATDHTIDDTAFLIRCRSEVPGNLPLYIDGKLGPTGNLDFFRIQFYSRPGAILLHNLTFLRANTIHDPVVYVICRSGDERLLTQLGTIAKIDQSAKSHEGDKPTNAPVGNFTLYRLTFFPTLPRYPLPNQITSLQAMERAPGPWCGPAF